MANTYTLISSNVLGSSAASVTFSAIPATYTDLIIRVTARSTLASISDDLTIRFNAGTSGYSRTILQGNGSTAGSLRTANAAAAIAYGQINGANATASTFGTAEVYIPNYTSTVSKPFSSFGVGETNATAQFMSIAALLSNLTSAITSVTLYPSIGVDFVSGSSFYLYGIKST
jgi:hypothetical protein